MCRKKELTASEKKAKEIRRKERRSSFENYLAVKQTIGTIFGAIGIILTLAGVGFLFWFLYTITEGLKGCGM